jgi:hypothetical protein
MVLLTHQKFFHRTHQIDIIEGMKWKVFDTAMKCVKWHYSKCSCILNACGEDAAFNADCLSSCTFSPATVPTLEREFFFRGNRRQWCCSFLTVPVVGPRFRPYSVNIFTKPLQHFDLMSLAGMLVLSEETRFYTIFNIFAGSVDSWITAFFCTLHSYFNTLWTVYATVRHLTSSHFLYLQLYSFLVSHTVWH